MRNTTRPFQGVVTLPNKHTGSDYRDTYGRVGRNGYEPPSANASGWGRLFFFLIALIFASFIVFMINLNPEYIQQFLQR